MIEIKVQPKTKTIQVSSIKEADILAERFIEYKLKSVEKSKKGFVAEFVRIDKMEVIRLFKIIPNVKNVFFRQRLYDMDRGMCYNICKGTQITIAGVDFILVKDACYHKSSGINVGGIDGVLANIEYVLNKVPLFPTIPKRVYEHSLNHNDLTPPFIL
jgi:hypothetical protein